MKMKYEKFLLLLSHVSFDVLVAACVFFIIHFVFSMPILWIGAVFVLSVMMRWKQLKKRY